MSRFRHWTARKVSTLDENAIDAEKFARAFPIARADLDPAEARKQTVRLFVTYVFLWLPAHCAICWLWSQSAVLATAAVAVIGTSALGVSLAKWLGLEDVLQKLPLLIILGLALVALGYLSSLANLFRFAGPEFFGLVLVVVTAVSILTGLYRPLAAAYQTVTTKLPLEDLVASGTALLTSLALAALASSMHWFWFAVIVSGAVGAYAGLVVIEYAAWAHANPNLELQYAMDFVKQAAHDEKKACHWDPIADVLSPVVGAAFVGAGYGVMGIFAINIASPTPEFYQLLVRLADDQAEKARDVFGTLLMLGFVMLLGGFYFVASPLKALGLTDPILALRLAWNALVIFLTYPESQNPLVHRLRVAWLRPMSVRVALTGVALTAIATAAFQPGWQASQKGVSEKSHASSAVTKVAAQNSVPPVRDHWDDFLNHRIEPSPMFPSPPPKPTQTLPDIGITRFVIVAAAVTVAPPAFVFVMIWIVGLTVLPTYFNYFERPKG